MGIFDDRRHTSPPSHVRQALLEEALAPLAALVPEHDTVPDEAALYTSGPLTAGDARRAAKLLGGLPHD